MTVFHTYLPAVPMRVVAVEVADGTIGTHEVPVLACFHEVAADGAERSDFLVFDSCDGCPARLRDSVWSQSHFSLVIGPQSNPVEWWDGEIAAAGKRLGATT